MLPDTSGYVEEFFGLPAHPLIVHGAVVLLPLCAIALILMAFIGSWRRKFGPVVLFLLALAVLFAYFSKESGESLAQVVGRPERHANLGTWLPFIAAGLFLLALIWLPLARNGDRPVSRSTSPSSSASASGDTTTVLAPATTTTAPRGPGPFTRFMALLTIIAAVTTLVWTVMVGHSGATAVWNQVLEPTPSPTPSPTASPTGSPTPTGTPSPTRTTSPSPTRTATPTPTRSPFSPSPTRTPTFPVTPNGGGVLPEDELDPAFS